MNRTQKIILISLLSVVLVTLTTAVVIRSRKKGIKKAIRKKGTLVCSHIGKFDGAGEVQAENQLNNVKKLIDNKIDMVELDVQITNDNVPVLYHDNTLNDKTNGSGSISDKNWNELSSVRYNEDKSAGLSKLKDVLDYIRQKNSSTILQLDKTDAKEIKKINELGLLKGVQKNILCKGKSFTKPQEFIDAGVMWMPIIPDSYVGKMNKMSVIDEIVGKCKGSDFLEAQFSDSDTLLIDGTLSKKLDNVGCRLLVVAVGGSKLTNGASFRGDKESQWAKMVNPMKAGVIMTNHPLKLQRYLKSVQ